MLTEKTNRSLLMRAPLRISLFGSGTDHPSYFANRQGGVLGLAINHYSYVFLALRERLLEERFWVSYSTIERVQSIDELENAILKVALSSIEQPAADKFLYCNSFGDLPAMSGLGSSSSFLVCLLQALSTVLATPMDRKELANKAIHLERNELGLQGGWQDQVFAAYGGINKIVFQGDSFVVSPLLDNQGFFEHLESSLYIVFLDKQRCSVTQQRKVSSHRNDLKQLAILEKQYEIMLEAAQVFASSSDHENKIKELGRLMNESWILKRSTSPFMSTPIVDDFYKHVLRYGALGGKLSGAGGGGFFTLLCSPSRVRLLSEMISPLKMIPVKISVAQGCETVFNG